MERNVSYQLLARTNVGSSVDSQDERGAIRPQPGLTRGDQSTTKINEGQSVSNVEIARMLVLGKLQHH